MKHILILLLPCLATIMPAQLSSPLALAVGVEDPKLLKEADLPTTLILVKDAAARERLQGVLSQASIGLLSDWSLQDWPPRLIEKMLVGDASACPPELVSKLLADGGSLKLAGLSPQAYEQAPLLERKGLQLIKLPTPGLDDWPMMRRDAGRSGYSRDQVSGPPQTPRWLAGGMFGETPTLAVGGMIITRESESSRSKNHKIRARNAFNGRLIWEQDFQLFDPEYIKGHPIGERGKLGGRGKLLGVFAHQGRVFVRAETELVSVRLKDGGDRKQIPVTDALWITPHEAGLLVVGNESTRLLDTKTGSARWSLDEAMLRPLVHENILVLMQKVKDQPNGSIITGRDIRTGKERWSKTIEDLAGLDLRSVTSQGELLIFGRIFPHEFDKNARNKKKPLIRLRTLDPKTGDTLWSSEALQPILNPIRMISEVDGTFYMVGRYRPKDGVKVDPRVKRFKIDSVNIGCQLAASTPNYILFKDHGGADLKGNHIASPKTFTLGKSVCGQQYIPAYGLSFITSQPCDCRGAGHWLRAGVPVDGNDPLLGQFSDPLGSIADEVGTFPTMKGEVDAESILKAHPAASSGWTHAYGSAERTAKTTGSLPISLTKLWERADITAVPSSHPAFPSVTGSVLDETHVYLSLVENGSVVALDRSNGEERWRWRGDSRIPSPPVVYRGLVLAGQQSGHVVALEAATGKLAWRTRVAPGVRVIADHGRISSMWPVNSPLTVVGDQVHGVAGLFFHWANTPRVFAIDLASGELSWSQLSRMNGRLLQSTKKGLLTSRETAVGAKWFGGVAVGHFDPETGAFSSLPRTGNSKPRVPAKSVVFRWRNSPAERRKHQGYTYHNGDRIRYEDGALFFYKHWKDQEGKTAGMYVKKQGGEVQTKLLPLEESLAPLGMAGDEQGIILTSANGTVTAYSD